MRCTRCKDDNDRVVDSRTSAEGTVINIKTAFPSTGLVDINTGVPSCSIFQLAAGPYFDTLAPHNEGTLQSVRVC